jgi:hypothetical protein
LYGFEQTRLEMFDVRLWKEIDNLPKVEGRKIQKVSLAPELQ